MRNLALIDKKSASCSFLKNCCAATVERNCMYFANQNELCKLDVDQKNPEENVSVLFISACPIKFYFLFLQVEILGPLDVGAVLDLKYLPEEDVLAIIAKMGSISVYNLNSSEVSFKFFLVSFG